MSQKTKCDPIEHDRRTSSGNLPRFSCESEWNEQSKPTFHFLLLYQKTGHSTTTDLENDLIMDLLHIKPNI